MPEQLMNYDQAAKCLGIAKGTLRNWVTDRRFPFIKVGRRTMFSPKDIDGFINANRVEAERSLN